VAGHGEGADSLDLRLAEHFPIEVDVVADDVSGWWYGRWQDIIMNSAGMLLGIYLAKGNLAPVAKIFT
jgi:hypothetical protein